MQLQAILQAAVQSVQWTYSVFWRFCPQQGNLIWGDGYYNGVIKTRKTLQPAEESSRVQRSQQLRELYDALSEGGDNSDQQAKWPSAALSPEDLTQTEWFYLMCASFSFPPGVGLTGRAYAKQQHIWLTGANEVDSKVFTRAILAKSARVQTVVCIPLLDGVVEFGTTERIDEDVNFIQQVKSLFIDYDKKLLLSQSPKPALSQHSTSNPRKSSSNTVDFHSPILIPAKELVDPPAQANENHEEESDEDQEEDEDEEDDPNFDSDDEIDCNSQLADIAGNLDPDHNELMQIDMSEDIRLGSPDNESHNLDCDYHLTKQGASEIRSFEELTREDTHYSQIVSAVLHQQSFHWLESSSTRNVVYCPQSAFTSWSTSRQHHTTAATSQMILKYILFSVPFLHCKYKDDNLPKPPDVSAAYPTSRLSKGAPQDELSGNHMLAERRRREKLNERFIILRSLVPFVTKMDKVSILGDTIEYVKQLRKKIQDLEENVTCQNQRSRGDGDPQKTRMTANLRSFREQRSMVTREKMRRVEQPPLEAVGEAAQVEVSIIECDALVELQCKYREGLLLDVMQKLKEHRVEIITVKSSLNNEIFVAELRAKVKENVNGKKVSIMEVKRAMNQIIPH